MGVKKRLFGCKEDKNSSTVEEEVEEEEGVERELVNALTSMLSLGTEPRGPRGSQLWEHTHTRIQPFLHPNTTTHTCKCSSLLRLPANTSLSLSLHIVNSVEASTLGPF